MPACIDPARCAVREIPFLGVEAVAEVNEVGAEVAVGFCPAEHDLPTVTVAQPLVEGENAGDNLPSTRQGYGLLNLSRAMDATPSRADARDPFAGDARERPRHRPAVLVREPSDEGIVIVTLDVSASMWATDLYPNRMEAAKEAAQLFVDRLPEKMRIGVVSFAATASVVQAPTHNREDILGAIDRFQLQRGTAIGSGILVSLKTILPDVEFDLRSQNPRPKADGPRPLIGGDVKPERKEPPKPVEDVANPYR